MIFEYDPKNKLASKLKVKVLITETVNILMKEGLTVNQIASDIQVETEYLEYVCSGQLSDLTLENVIDLYIKLHPTEKITITVI